MKLREKAFTQKMGTKKMLNFQKSINDPKKPESSIVTLICSFHNVTPTPFTKNVLLSSLVLQFLPSFEVLW